MTDWLSPMQQTFEYYTVDPRTWKDIKKLNNVKSSTIKRDSSSKTLGSASIVITESLGESYIRVYLVTIQNGIRERHPLGTFLMQTPSSKHDGKSGSITVDAYTPLIELKENRPPIGYSVLKDANIMETVYLLTREHLRAPVVKTENDKTLFNDFVANTNDTWVTFNADLMANAKYYYGLDELSRILFLPKQDTAALQPVWTYNDDNSSILYRDVTVDHDLYGIPNVVEVIYSTNNENYYARAVNNDESSPTSIQSRGREILHRVTNPQFGGEVTQEMIDDHAEMILREKSTLAYTVTYKHGYCPVRLGDCVRLNYRRADLNNIKARVISQSITCEPGCPVTEKAVFTKKLYR